MPERKPKEQGKGNRRISAHKNIHQEEQTGDKRKNMTKTTPNKQAELEKEILNRCAKEEGYVDYEELEILHQDCPKATKIYKKALTEGIKEGKAIAEKDIEELRKDFNQMISDDRDANDIVIFIDKRLTKLQEKTAQEIK